MSGGRAGVGGAIRAGAIQAGAIRAGAIRAGASGAGQDVAVVVCDGLSLMELGVACDIFGGPYGAWFGVPWYRMLVCGPGDSALTDAGFRIEVPHGLEALGRADRKSVV